MTALRVLIIGGNGIISASVSRLAVERGFDVTLLNRGIDTTRPPIDGTTSILGDADDPASIAAAVGDLEFDVVANFRSFVPSQVEADVALFSGRAGQYLYISSASAYQKPVAGLPIRESTPLRNPVLGVLAQQGRERGRAEPGVSRPRLPDHDRAPVAHL